MDPVYLRAVHKRNKIRLFAKRGNDTDFEPLGEIWCNRTGSQYFYAVPGKKPRRKHDRVSAIKALLKTFVSDWIPDFEEEDRLWKRSIK